MRLVRARRFGHRRAAADLIPILLIGHGINLFMSTISSFVPPMRLTFVEFYKNAGFEMSMRSFEPLQKIDNSENK